MDKQERSFTEALESLEKAAQTIGRQETSLEDALKLFEQGMKDAEYCNKVLEEAKQQIEIYKEEYDA